MVHVFPLRGFRGIGRFAVPAPADFKGRSVQVERHRRLFGRISHLMVSNVVRNVGEAALGIIDFRDTIQLPIVPDLSNASLEDLQPATVAGVIVDWRFLFRIPAQ